MFSRIVKALKEVYESEKYWRKKVKEHNRKTMCITFELHGEKVTRRVYDDRFEGRGLAPWKIKTAASQLLSEPSFKMLVNKQISKVK
jgi:hypothetical protein